jgi:hypothetical protein
MKVEIEIPDPPEGWVFDGYRKVAVGEMALHDDGRWYKCQFTDTGYRYPVAIKEKPLWEPSPAIVAALIPGWLTRDKNECLALHSKGPRPLSDRFWASDGLAVAVHCIRPELLPPADIPWDQCCFKIGEPDES